MWNHGLHTLDQLIAGGHGKGSEGAIHCRRILNHIARAAAVNLGNRNHNRFQWIKCPADQCLNSLINACGNEQRVFALVWECRMAAFAGNRYGKPIRTGHNRSWSHGEVGLCKSRQIVQRKNCRERKPGQQAIIDHVPGTAKALFRRLKDEHGLPCKIAVFGQIFCGHQ